MFFHNFKYTFRTIFRDRMLIFWTFAFPIILGTFFHLAFSNIENSEKMEIIPVAVVENSDWENDAVWQTCFATLSDETSESQLFQTQYTTEETAKQLLEEKKIAGYFILAEKEPKIVVAGDGMDETVLKSVVEEVLQAKEMVQTVATHELEKSGGAPSQEFFAQLSSRIMEKMGQETGGIRDVSGDRLSYTMIEFYTLIAMACLYGSMIGLVAINRNLANVSAQGMRVAVSPVKKSNLIFSSILAGFLIQLLGIALLFLYTIFVLHVDYGSNLPMVLLLTFCGSLAGLSFGVLLGACMKASESAKTGIIIAFTMAGCFLSGMMGITMKYIIDQNLPLLNRLNPANMITDGFYALYYYETPDRFLLNLVSLLLFSLVCMALSIWKLRRQKYDCI